MYDVISNILQQQLCTAHNIKGAKPSSQAVAVWRAAHQLLEQPPVFVDPIALPILGDAKTDVIDKLEIHKDPLSSAMRIAIAVRSRFAEDERKHVQGQIHQYVILGAGLDTYAYRNKNLDERIFEVDLPTTQSMKKVRVEALAVSPPATLAYVACNFEKDELEKSLIAAGFDKNQKAFFSWLGVVPYIDMTAIEQTLQFVGECTPGSILIFDYIVHPTNLNPMENKVLNILSAHLAAGGEPLKSFFDPQQLAQKLADSGFRKIDDISPDYLNKRYLLAREDGLRVGNVTRMFKVIV